MVERDPADVRLEQLEAENNTLRQQLIIVTTGVNRVFGAQKELLCGRWRRRDGTIYAPVKKS